MASCWPVLVLQPLPPAPPPRFLHGPTAVCTCGHCPRGSGLHYQPRSSLPVPIAQPWKSASFPPLVFRLGHVTCTGHEHLDRRTKQQAQAWVLRVLHVSTCSLVSLSSSEEESTARSLLPLRLGPGMNNHGKESAQPMPTDLQPEPESPQLTHKSMNINIYCCVLLGFL